MADKKILELNGGIPKAAPEDTDALPIQEAGGAPGSTVFTLFSGLWDWAKTKADLLYAAIGHTHTGVYDPAGTAAGERADHESDYTHADIALNTGARHTHANLTVLDAVSGTNTGDEVTFAGAGAEGLVPDPVAETGKYLRDDGTWQIVTGGDATQAFGTISVAGQSDVVADAAPDTLVMAAGANIQIVTDAATDTVTIAAAHDHSGVYQPSSATLTTLASATAAGLALMDDSDASTQRGTLGLGGSATLDVGTSAGTVAAGDHTHSGVYQPVDDDLTALAALSGTGGYAKRTAADTWSIATPTAADVGALTQAQADLLYEPAGDYQPASSTLTTLANATAAGLALMDDADASAQRGTLGLGGSATLAVGTTAGTVAAGDHTHSGVYQPASSTLTTLASATAAGLALMDDADASTQRSTLGLGGSATLSVGTTTGTVAAGDDSRFALPYLATFTPAGAAVTVNFSTTAKTASVTLGDASTAVTLSGGVAGKVYLLLLQQDGAGSRAATFGAELDFSADITAVPTLSTGASKRDLLGVLCITPGSSYFLTSYNRGF